MNEIERILNFRKVFLCLANKVVTFLFFVLGMMVFFATYFVIKEYNAIKDCTIAYTEALNNYELNVQTCKKNIIDIEDSLKTLNIEKSKFVNEIDYNSVARSVLTYSISKHYDMDSYEEIDLFFRSINNALNNGNIARKLQIANRSNNLFSIDLGNALDFDNSVLLIVSITAKENDILETVEKDIETIVLKEFADFKIVLKSIERHELDSNLLYDLNEKEQKLALKISEMEHSLVEMKDKSFTKPTKPVKTISLGKIINKAVLGLIFSCLLVAFYEVCKKSFIQFVNDINFAPKYLGIQNLAVLDSERIKKNWLTKLFMRKATYSNKDAYGIVSVYLKEKENLSVLSFLDSEKENEFKKETGANVVNCNGDLSELFKVIADKNNFVILIDTETTRTKQVVEVYNFVKNLGLEMYGAVVYTI